MGRSSNAHVNNFKVFQLPAVTGGWEVGHNFPEAAKVEVGGRVEVVLPVSQLCVGLLSSSHRGWLWGRCNKLSHDPGNCISPQMCSQICCVCDSCIDAPITRGLGTLWVSMTPHMLTGDSWGQILVHWFYLLHTVRSLLLTAAILDPVAQNQKYLCLCR